MTLCKYPDCSNHAPDAIEYCCSGCKYDHYDSFDYKVCYCDPYNRLAIKDCTMCGDGCSGPKKD